jgi:hypothetical protein
MDTRGCISAVLSTVGIQGDALNAALAAAIDAYRSPPAVPSVALDTSALSRYLRTIKLRASPDSTRQLEDAFMALVAKVDDAAPAQSMAR